MTAVSAPAPAHDAHLVRIDHVSDHGRWSLFRQRPSLRLAPYVRELQGYVEAAGKAVLRKEVPFGGIPMIVVFGPGFSLHDRSDPRASRPLARSFVAGLHRTPTLIGSHGTALCMQVDFTPQGAFRFCGLDMSDLSDRVVDLDAILGACSARLEERLGEAPNWATRFAILERFLWERLSRGPLARDLVARAWSKLERSGGSVSVVDLAASLGCSRKHLAEHFRREIGLPPKAVARVLRFERALAALERGRVGTLADLAASCGYTDQAHFNRDFHHFAGESPGKLMQKKLSDGTGIIETPR
jgi:AraC-like DNA-binding protein